MALQILRFPTRTFRETVEKSKAKECTSSTELRIRANCRRPKLSLARVLTANFITQEIAELSAKRCSENYRQKLLKRSFRSLFGINLLV